MGIGIPAQISTEVSLVGLLFPNISNSSNRDEHTSAQNPGSSCVPKILRRQSEEASAPRNLPHFQSSVPFTPLPPVLQLDYEIFSKRYLSGYSSEDEKVFLKFYPMLRQAYDADFEALYSSIEEACARILGNTKFPDLSDYTSSKTENELDSEVMKAFLTGIKELEEGQVVKKIQDEPLPQKAVESFKNWQALNPSRMNNPRTESRIALAFETGVDLNKLSKWFEKQQGPRQNGFTGYGDSNSTANSDSV